MHVGLFYYKLLITVSYLYLSVTAEIQERWDFLEEMEALGRGKQYFNIINTEISQVTRDLQYETFRRFVYCFCVASFILRFYLF